MNVGDAERRLLSDTEENDGTFSKLRSGIDPGETDVQRLISALRILHHANREGHFLPRDITRAAATILHFRFEAEGNLRDSKSPIRPELVNELSDLSQAAFNLLVDEQL